MSSSYGAQCIFHFLLVGTSACALNPAVRFALPELELGTVVEAEEEPEDWNCRRQQAKSQSKYKKISWISRKMLLVSTVGFSMNFRKV